MALLGHRIDCIVILEVFLSSGFYNLVLIFSFSIIIHVWQPTLYGSSAPRIRPEWGVPSQHITLFNSSLVQRTTSLPNMLECSAIRDVSLFLFIFTFSGLGSRIGRSFQGRHLTCSSHLTSSVRDIFHWY